MTSFKRFGSKHVVKYAYIDISADRQRHNLLWLFKYRICPIRIEIIHGGLNIYWFYHGLALYNLKSTALEESLLTTDTVII